MWALQPLNPDAKEGIVSKLCVPLSRETASSHSGYVGMNESHFKAVIKSHRLCLE